MLRAPLRRLRCARRGGTRVPRVDVTCPSTFTQPFSIHSSASRREHRPSSLIRFDRRGFSGTSGVVETRGRSGAGALPRALMGGFTANFEAGVDVGLAASAVTDFGAGFAAGTGGGAADARGVAADLRSCCARRARDDIGCAGCADLGFDGSLMVGRGIGRKFARQFGNASAIVADFGGDLRALTTRHLRRPETEPGCHRGGTLACAIVRRTRDSSVGRSCDAPFLERDQVARTRVLPGSGRARAPSAPRRRVGIARRRSVPVRASSEMRKSAPAYEGAPDETHQPIDGLAGARRSTYTFYRCGLNLSIQSLSKAQVERLIRTIAADGSRVFVTAHAALRMRQRHVTRDIALEVLRKGRLLRIPEVNLRRGSLECRMERYCTGRQLGVVVAISDDDPDLLVITVIET